VILFSFPFDSLKMDNRIQNLLSIAEECETKERLADLIQSGRKFTAYNGFEPSGRIHIAQAIITVLNTNTIIDNGGRMIIYIADWFAQLNHKMGGDLAKIREVGLYFIEVFKAIGINLEGTEFIWASDFINNNKNYLPRVLHISTMNSLNRIKRCCQIMGRKDGDELSSSQIIYPCMQCADIFELVPGGVDICQLGVDQRKVNMLAIEYAQKCGLKVPIILSHHMLMGLKGPANKMSKSDPSSAIFMDDTEEQVHNKIMGAFCNDDVANNPIFEYIQYIIFRWFKKITLCQKEYTDLDEIINDFPQMDKKHLKLNVANYINQIIEPVRKHFEIPKLKSLAERVASYRITR
jgi:tyrosyl-tRNA synthetase